ncbi:MAG: hypothetical protein JWN15_51, partial [Firmicutes bacterium]|nr:hypothetical protein [Bacillota bacterium]
NLAGGPSTQLLLGALNAELGLPLPTTRVALIDQPVASEALDAYVGTYCSGEDEEIKIASQDGNLVMEYQGQQWPARCVGAHTFAIKVKELEGAARFLLNEQGQVYAVAYHYRIIRKVA